MSVFNDAELENLCVTKFLTETLRTANRENLSYLFSAITADVCAFFLGAGVSKGIGLPLWQELIDELFFQGLSDGISSSSNRVLDDMLSGDFNAFERIRDKFRNEVAGVYTSVNAIESAEYILLRYGRVARKNSEHFQANGSYQESTARSNVITAVRYALKACYDRKKKAPDEDGKPDWDLLSTISRFFAQTNRDSNRTNHPIRQVITYNFDDALEFAAQEKLKVDDYIVYTYGIDDFFTPPDKNENRTAIYHPHGVLKVFRGDGLEDRRIVFTESDYNEMEAHFYNNSNTIQARALNTMNCLFVGLSMQDYNMKRIIRGLDSTAQEKTAFDDILSRDIYNIDGLESKHKERMHFMFLPIDPCIGKNRDGSDVMNAIRHEYIADQARYLIHRRIFPIFITYRDIAPVLKMLLSKLGR